MVIKINNRKMEDPKGYQKCLLKCANCGKKYIKHKIPGQKNTYCSKKCYFETFSDKGNPNYKGGPLKRKCKICNITFYQKRNGKNENKCIRKTCSEKCMKALMSKNGKMISDKQAKMSKEFRRTIAKCFKKDIKNPKWVKFLGYSPKELREHFEKNFKGNMNWNNYGGQCGWQIDHIKPICSFKYENFYDTDFIKCWSLSNLQPLWPNENAKKGRSLKECL